MRVYQAVTLLLAGSVILTGSRGSPRESSPVEQARWLAGCWELKRGNRTGFEMWMPPAGGVMMGASRTVANGQVVEWERLQLSGKDGNLVYTSLPSGQSEASFTSTVMNDSSFTVENLQHDFPQRIIYRKHGADSLIARIEGPGPNGPRGIDFPMRRADCEAS
jgi:hypothetical protein